MKIANLLLIVLLFFTMAAEGATSANRAKMKSMYEENLRLIAQRKELQREIEKVDREIRIAERAVENYKFVRAENMRFMETIRLKSQIP